MFPERAAEALHRSAKEASLSVKNKYKAQQYGLRDQHPQDVWGKIAVKILRAKSPGEHIVPLENDVERPGFQRAPGHNQHNGYDCIPEQKHKKQGHCYVEIQRDGAVRQRDKDVYGRKRGVFRESGQIFRDGGVDLAEHDCDGGGMGNKQAHKQPDIPIKDNLPG